MRIALTFAVVSLLAFGCTEAEEPITQADDLPHLPDEVTEAPAAADRIAEPAENRVGAPRRERRPRPPTQVNAAGADPQAPATFTVRLNTTKGAILVDVTRAWSPHGADRFHRLVTDGFYTDVAFFRVIDGFMAQGGIHGDPNIARQWQNRRIPDDPVVQSNRRGFLSFAMAGPGSRTTQFFINLVDNQRLDGMGFAPFARVQPASLSVVDQLHSGYGEGAPRGRGPAQGRMQAQGNTYLRSDFPNLDYIRTAEIMP
ncbi:MAG: peptidylprolyl isomerase [Sandaracinaceae bacterium]